MQKIVLINNFDTVFTSVKNRQHSFGRWATFFLSFFLLLTSFSQSAHATGFYKNFVIIKSRINNTQKETYYHAKSDGTDPFASIDGANLGSIDRTNDLLQISGAEANTRTEPTTDGVVATRLYYTVYPAGARPGSPAFTALNLPLNNTQGNTQKWVAANTTINLIALAGFVGTYTLELYYEGDGTYPGGTFPLPPDNNNNPATNYRATFTVTNNPPPIKGTTWTGNAKTKDWFTAGNWSNGVVPDRLTDVTIPILPAQATYPQIEGYSAQGNPAETRTLRIEGTGPTNRAQLSLTGGELRVHGNFENSANGFSSGGGDFVLAGTTQDIDAGSFYNLRIEGGGNKTIKSRIEVQSFLNMIAGTLETRVDQPAQYSVDLKRDARIIGESDQSYIIGVLRNDRVLTQGNRDDFGNIGISVTANGGAPGKTFVTRTTSVSFANVGGKPGIKRSFDFSTVDTNTNLDATISFAYLASDLTNTGTVEGDLKLFETVLNGSAFDDLKRDAINTGAKVLTKSGVNALRLFTLGDGVVPLPVSLTSFAATRQGPGALLTWTTAQEENNYGFDVQVSTDGQNFRTLSTILSQSPNTTQAHAYQYRDAEPGKNGTRYYRLRQRDKDGKEAFYGPRVLTFDGQLVAFSAAPNPFTADLTLTAQSDVAGAATLRLTDLNGRLVREQTVTVAKGVSTLPVTNLAGLAGGLYFVQLVQPDGQVQRLKLVKK